jgi:hypothetical protein
VAECKKELASFVSRLSQGRGLESVRADFVRDFSRRSLPERSPVPEVQKL